MTIWDNFFLFVLVLFAVYLSILYFLKIFPDTILRITCFLVVLEFPMAISVDKESAFTIAVVHPLEIQVVVSHEF